MNDSWFDEYMFEIAAPQSALPPELQAALDAGADRAAGLGPDGRAGAVAASRFSGSAGSAPVSAARTWRAISRSSRVATIRVRTGARCGDVGVSPPRRCVASLVDGDAEEGEPGGGRGADRLVLADAAGEHEHVEAAQGRGHGGDLAAQAVDVDVDGQAACGSPRSAAAATSRMSPVPAGRPARPARPEACSSSLASSSAVTPPCSSSQSSRPGSTLPERVAMTRPSSGVKPIVVSTDRPSRTAASEAPAPRWQVTIRSGRRGAGEQLGGPRAAYAWERPWKP